MKKPFADKFSKKIFFTPIVQKAWKELCIGFGPILEPAFPEDFRTRIDLGSALSQLKKGNLQGAFRKLNRILHRCKTDADFAAWFFFMGVCFECAQDSHQACAYFRAAEKYGHIFHKPYLSTAAWAAIDRKFDVSEKDYKKALECLNLQGNTDTTLRNNILGSIAGALILMHRTEEAEIYLQQAKEQGVFTQDLWRTEALLAAVKGEKERAEECLTKAMERGVSLRPKIEKIFTGESYHFFVQPVDENAIKDFWVWFLEEETHLIYLLEKRSADECLNQIVKGIEKIFPTELQEELNIGIKPSNTSFEVLLMDGYSKTVEATYHTLLSARPEGIRTCWTFTQSH